MSNIIAYQVAEGQGTTPFFMGFLAWNDHNKIIGKTAADVEYEAALAEMNSWNFGVRLQ